MPVARDLKLYQGNQEIFTVTVTKDDDGLPQNLTGLVVNVYLKAARETADLDASTVKLSTSTGEIVLTTPLSGLCTVTVPASALATAGRRWWRCDVIIGGQAKTAAFGPLLVVDT
jgi:hypothetical protein